ncbi:LOW QUALITY PROTEIN: hypothetical protein U9M48_031696 [Paspalum notatum var. saurae]|uniref:Uncharacterized protein n=1 Tax=Paspalum notatum var. saurae TaxID=547442 RepID=A0AAQ3X4N7_PASNO
MAPSLHRQQQPISLAPWRSSNSLPPWARPCSSFPPREASRQQLPPSMVPTLPPTESSKQQPLLPSCTRHICSPPPAADLLLLHGVAPIVQPHGASPLPRRRSLDGEGHQQQLLPMCRGDGGHGNTCYLIPHQGPEMELFTMASPRFGIEPRLSSDPRLKHDIDPLATTGCTRSIAYALNLEI